MPYHNYFSACARTHLQNRNILTVVIYVNISIEHWPSETTIKFSHHNYKFSQFKILVLNLYSDYRDKRLKPLLNYQLVCFVYLNQVLKLNLF